MKIFAAALFAATLAGLGAASAMPLAPLATTDSSAVIQVAQGCGPGYARGPRGFCRPMARGPVVVVRPAPVYVPRAVVVAPRAVARRAVCPPRMVWVAGRCRY